MTLVRKENIFLYLVSRFGSDWNFKSEKTRNTFKIERRKVRTLDWYQAARSYKLEDPKQVFV